MTGNEKQDNKLKWRFDISTFRLIGRDLITDRITALFELVKNCYDANASRVDIFFEKVSLNDGIVDPLTKEMKVNLQSKITIKDDGLGMSFADIRDKWMVIGTASKRKEPFTPPPFLVIFFERVITSRKLSWMFRISLVLPDVVPALSLIPLKCLEDFNASSI